jgi:hypothetical protein
MKLLIKKLWFPWDVNRTARALFKIPQVQEHFNEGFNYVGEMRPRGIKIFSGYWPADAILNRLPKSERDVTLILTSMDLKGDYGRIYGKGYDRRAIASNHGFIGGANNELFDYYDIDFNAMIMEEIGHALGLSHHETDNRQRCPMTRNKFRETPWINLRDICFCEDCYRGLR